MEKNSKNLNNDGNARFFCFLCINFLTTGQQAATFSWQDKRTLSQIEQMTGYKVKPRGVISNFKHGGYVVWEKDGHGLVAAVCDLEKRNWTNAKIACEALDINGYSDWHLPTKEELQYLYKNLHQVGIADFERRQYWSSTAYGNYKAWGQDFYGGDQFGNFKSYPGSVRAVRAF